MTNGIVPPTELATAWQTDMDQYPRGERRGNAVIIVVAVLLFTTLWILALRLWARFKVQANAGLDDILIVLAAIPTTGLSVSIILGHVCYGFDRHAWELSMEDGFETRKISFVVALLYVIGTGLTKVSILCFHRRLSDTISPRYLVALQAAIAFVIAYMVTFTITLCIGCRPLQAFWKQLDPRWRAKNDFKCFDEAADILAASAVSLVQDLLVCGLPLLIMWQLSIPKRQKIALSGIFSLGIFLCIVGAVRIYYIYEFYYDGSYDATWAAGHVWIWTAVEACLGIACASAPALRLFFRRVLGGTSVDASTGHSHRFSRSWGISDGPSGMVSRAGRWSHLSSKIRGSGMDFVDASTASGGDGHSMNSTTTSELNHVNHLHSISELDYSSLRKTAVSESIQEIDEEGLPGNKDEECRIGSLQWVVSTPKNAVSGKSKPYYYSSSELARNRSDTFETSPMSKKSSPSLQSLRSGRSQQNIGSASPKLPAAAHLRTYTDSNDRHPPPPPTCRERHCNQTHLPPNRPPPLHTSTSSTSPSTTTSSPKMGTDRPHRPPPCTARHYNQTHLQPIRPPPPHSSGSLGSPSTTSSPATGTGTKSSLPPITPSPPEVEILEDESTVNGTDEGRESYDDDVVDFYTNSPTPPPAPAKSPSLTNWPLPASSPDVHRQVPAQTQSPPQRQSPQQQPQPQRQKQTTNAPYTTIFPTTTTRTTTVPTQPSAPPPEPPAPPAARRSIGGDTMLMDADALFNHAARAADLEIANEEKKRKALAAAAAAQTPTPSHYTTTTSSSFVFGQGQGQRDLYARRGALPGGEELCSGMKMSAEGRW